MFVFIIYCHTLYDPCQHKTDRVFFPFLDSSSASERRPVEKKPAPLPEKKAPVMSGTLKRKLSIKKDMRPELEQAVAKALEDLGVKSVRPHTPFTMMLKSRLTGSI